MRSFGSERMDVPSGIVPDYKTFCRLVWSYRDEAGETALSSPPWVYTMFLEDSGEMFAAGSIAIALNLKDPDGDGKLDVTRSELGLRVSFASLAVLHQVLTSLAVVGHQDEQACKLAEFILWTLGFRWV